MDKCLSIEKYFPLIKKGEYNFFWESLNTIFNCLKSVKDFKIRLVSAFCENHKNAQVIDAAALRAIAASQQGLDVVYPAIGDNFDFLRRLRDESGVLFHFLKRPEDVFCWQFAKKGFFNFKKNIPLIIEKIIKTKDFFI